MSPFRALAVAVLLVVASRTAEAAIALRNPSLPADTHVRKRVDVVVEIHSDSPVTSAFAQVPGVPPGRDMWLVGPCTPVGGAQLCERRGVELDMSTRAPAEGAYQVVVAVANQAGERAELTIPFVYDRPPRVAATDPAHGLVPRTRYVTVRGTCTDTLSGGPCPTVTVRRIDDVDGSVVIATRTNVTSFEVEVDLRSLEARSFSISIIGGDGYPIVNYPTNEYIVEGRIEVDNSPAYRRIGEAPAGYVRSASSTRAVFLVNDWYTSEHAAGGYERLPGAGVVTTRGVAWQVDRTLFVRSDGVVREYEIGPSEPRVAGRFLAWDTFRIWEPVEDADVHLLDVETGQHTVITGAYRPWPSETGSMYFLRPGTPARLVYRDVEGERQVATGRQVFASDGVNALARSTGCVPELYGPSGLIERLPDATCTGGRDYPAVVRNGWVAYSFPPGGVFRRSPAGVRTRIGNNLGIVEDISPAGEVAYNLRGPVAPIGSRGRWIVPAGAGATKVGSSLGAAYWREDRWFLIMGSSTFHIMGPTTPEPPPIDAGVPDAGGADGGIVDAAPADAASVDAGVDAPVDAGVDAPVDAGVDAPVDAGVDAPVDAAPVVADAAVADAAPGAPDGGAVEPQPDAGEDEPGDGEGCSAGGAPGALIMLALGALIRRRRRPDA